MEKTLDEVMLEDMKVRRFWQKYMLEEILSINYIMKIYFWHEY